MNLLMDLITRKLYGRDILERCNPWFIQIHVNLIRPIRLLNKIVSYETKLKFRLIGYKSRV